MTSPGVQFVYKRETTAAFWNQLRALIPSSGGPPRTQLLDQQENLNTILFTSNRRTPSEA